MKTIEELDNLKMVCNAKAPATYTDPTTGNKLYNQAALSQLIDQARLEELESVSKALFIEAAIKARIKELQNRLTKGESDG